MKKWKLFNLLLLPLLFGGFTLLSASNLSNNEPNVIEVKAIDYLPFEDFMSEYTTIRNAQADDNRPSACDANKEEYDQIMEIYDKLNQNDRQKAVNTPDPIQENYTIGQYINEIVRKFYTPAVSNSASKPKLNQSTTIIIAVVVSIFGMSAISVLYIMKNNKVID